MKLSPNFHLDEFTTSQTAQRQGIDNTPPADVLEKLKHTASQMELVRAFLGKPVLISSGYRSPALNKAVGGSNTSQHTKGEAVDFTSPGFGSPRQIMDAIVKSGINYDQIALEYNRWIHISFSTKNRKQALIIDKAGTRVFA